MATAEVITWGRKSVLWIAEDILLEELVSRSNIGRITIRIILCEYYANIIIYSIAGPFNYHANIITRESMSVLALLL